MRTTAKLLAIFFVWVLGGASAQAEVQRRVLGNTTEYHIEQDGATLLSAGRVTVEIDRVQQTHGEIRLWLKARQASGARKSVFLHFPEAEAKHSVDLGRIGPCKVQIEVNGDRLAALTVRAPTK
jgi:hypothetical protein